MHFYLITFLISAFLIPFTWGSPNKVGLTNIFQIFYQTTFERFKKQGLSIFAFAFFLHAVLQSKAFQAFFASKAKWLQKRKYFSIALITTLAALLSSNLSWFDEFVHFYPLVIPILLAMGFDTFSSLLCLYGGSIAGLMGLVSTERMKEYFDLSFGPVAGDFNYGGASGIIFRLVSFVLFVTILVLFNIWYCSRNKAKKSDKLENLMSEEKPPLFNRTKKIILAVTAFFLLVGVFAQFPFVKKINKHCGKVPEWISSNYSNEEEKYKEIGSVGEKRVAKVEDNKKNYWDDFGGWEAMSIDCWLIIGGIIICWLSKQSIMDNLITSVQKSIPLLIVYIFAAVPAKIMSVSGMSEKLAGNILSPTASGGSSSLTWILLSVVALSFVLSFFIPSPALSGSLVATIAPVLLAFSENALIHASMFSWIGAMLGMSFSPNNGILIASLEKNKITYKEFFKKAWKLFLIMSITTLCLLLYWIKFNIK